MKREALGHTKMKRLCRRLDIPLWQAVGILETLWALTARECPRGDIGKLSNEDIALGLDYRGDENLLIASLVSCGWLDERAKERLVVHDWHDHADDAVHLRLARSKEFFVGGFPPKLTRLGGREKETAQAFYTVRALKSAQSDDPCAQNIDPCALNGARKGESCAPPEPEPVPEPEPEPEPFPLSPPEGGDCRVPKVGRRKSKRTTAEIRKALGDREVWWKACWEAYPCQDGMNPAMDAFERKVHTRELAEEIYRGIKRYAAKVAADPTAKVKYMQGWINDERWTDENNIPALLTMPQRAAPTRSDRMDELLRTGPALQTNGRRLI